MMGHNSPKREPYFTSCADPQGSSPRSTYAYQDAYQGGYQGAYQEACYEVKKPRRSQGQKAQDQKAQEGQEVHDGQEAQEGRRALEFPRTQ
jgi:hypothetical protein